MSDHRPTNTGSYQWKDHFEAQAQMQWISLHYELLLLIQLVHLAPLLVMRSQRLEKKYQMPLKSLATSLCWLHH